MDIPAERIAFVGPRRVEIESFTLPAPGPRQVLVRATRTLVSAGTELKAYVGEDVVQRDPPYPRYPGYSHVGVVERAGAAVTEVRVGDRVGTQQTHASRALVYRAAAMKDAGAPMKEFKQAAAVAKLYTTESAVTATRIATQVFGGYGFMEEYAVARFYRDAKVLEIGEGTSEVQRMLIARGLGLPVE